MGDFRLRMAVRIKPSYLEFWSLWIWTNTPYDSSNIIYYQALEAKQVYFPPSVPKFLDNSHYADFHCSLWWGCKVCFCNFSHTFSPPWFFPSLWGHLFRCAFLLKATISTLSAETLPYFVVQHFLQRLELLWNSVPILEEALATTCAIFSTLQSVVFSPIV